jgi:predicted RNA methylase
MNGLRKSTWLPVMAIIVVCLVAVACNGSSSTVAAHNCQGDLTVVESDVARVDPAPREEYVVNQSYSWTEPPYGVEVTGADGEAVMQIYDASNVLLSKYTIYAAALPMAM